MSSPRSRTPTTPPNMREPRVPPPIAVLPQQAAQQGNRLNQAPILENRNFPNLQLVANVQPMRALATNIAVVSPTSQGTVPVIQNPNNLRQITPPAGQPLARTQQFQVPVAANLMDDFDDEDETVVTDDETEMGGGSVMRHTVRNLFYKVR